MEGRALRGRDRVLIGFGALGAATAWALQLVFGYGIEDSMCSVGSTDTQPPIALVTVAAALVALASGLSAYASWRRVEGEWRDPRGRVRFLAVTGMIAAGFFLVLIALGGLQLLSLDSCSQG
jgi:uncharacterized membrane protein YidH (DUF202 family)